MAEIQKMTKRETISARQRDLIIVLSTPPYPSLKDAAEQIRVRPSTAYKWNMVPEFEEAWKQARHDTVEELCAGVRRRIKESSPEVFEQKLSLAKNADSESVRDSATTWLLEYALGKLTNQLEIGTKDDKPIPFTIRIEGSMAGEE